MTGPSQNIGNAVLHMDGSAQREETDSMRARASEAWIQPLCARTGVRCGTIISVCTVKDAVEFMLNARTMTEIKA